MKSVFIGCTAMAIALLAQPAAAATFAFTASGTNLASSGTFTTTNTTTTVSGRQAYTITGISGTFNNSAITSLLATGTNFGGELTDNYLFVQGNNFTLGGVGFTIANAAFQGNFYSSSGNAFFSNSISATGSTVRPANQAITFQLAVPEPATWAMLLLGFAMVGATMRMGRRRTTVTFA